MHSPNTANNCNTVGIFLPADAYYSVRNGEWVVRETAQLIPFKPAAIVKPKDFIPSRFRRRADYMHRRMGNMCPSKPVQIIRRIMQDKDNAKLRRNGIFNFATLANQ